MTPEEEARNAAHLALLHPVRMRIVVALAGRELTPRQLRLELPDVPQATLYQHIGRLTRAGALRVVAERPARGATERVYALNARVVALQPSAQASPETLNRYFTTFIAALLADGGRYLRHADIDPARDGFGFHQLILYAAPGEMRALSQALTAALMPYFTQGETPGRQRLLYSSVFVPQELPVNGPVAPATPHAEDIEGRDNA